MSTALIVGGDQIQGIKHVLEGYGINHINHWSGRKVGDAKKVIPHDTKVIVLVTNWISHSFTHKIKQTAAKRGVRIIYTPNGPAALRARLEKKADTLEYACRLIRKRTSLFLSRINRFITSIISI